MKLLELKNFKGGWLVGDFEPSLFKRDNVEVGIHKLQKGSISDGHYHLRSNEYNLILKGKVKNIISNEVYEEGDIFIYEPHDKSKIEFLEDTKLLVIRDSSDPTDKYFD